MKAEFHIDGCYIHVFDGVGFGCGDTTYEEEEPSEDSEEEDE